MTGRAFVAMAHRGGEGLWPSNTLYAYTRAAALGVNALEMDIHRSADGALIVRHDPVVDTTTNGQGAIRDLTLAQIKTLDAGYTWTADGGQSFPFRGQGIVIPTLDEVFAAFPSLDINIDIKSPEPEAVDTLAALIERAEMVEQVMVGSFIDAQLARFRRRLPGAKTAAGASETRNFLLFSMLHLEFLFRSPVYAFQVPEWSGSAHIVTPRFIRAAHARGKRVHVWTVDEPADMRRLMDWGVDGLIADYPDRLMALL